MKLRLILPLLAILGVAPAGGASGAEPAEGVRPVSQYVTEKVLPVGRVPAGFPVRFALVTAHDRQYVGYYDQDRQMTIASRELGSDQWTYQPLPSQVGWDSHNYITMAVDGAGQLHVSGNMHNVPLIYFRTETPGDIRTLKRRSMVGESESSVTYPRFLTDAAGQLIFTYRQGSSGNGANFYNRYDEAQRQWTRLLDTPLFDGEDLNNAYPMGPQLRSDGYFHVVWVWRETPDCATNHHLSYARSRDLVNWETAGGKPVALPMTLADQGTWVDPISVGGGIINGCQKLLIDAQNRPIVAYHKSDDEGHMQLYAARFEDGQWVVRPATDWNEPVHFSGNGSMGFIGISLHWFKRVSPDVLAMSYRHKDYGSGRIFLNEETLQASSEQVAIQPELPRELNQVQSDFEGMGIRRAWDAGQAPQEDVRYMLQWETLSSNRDKPREPPLPEPSDLRLIKLKRVDRE